MVYRRKAVSLSDFEPVGQTTDEDLLEITFHNFQTIFVHMRGIDSLTRQPTWVVHEDFCPSSLTKSREPGMDYSEDIKGRPFNVPVNVTATVGQPAEFYVHPNQYLKSASTVTSILPAAYRDAYHDDLELAVSVNS
jgi:hypothetical protein